MIPEKRQSVTFGDKNTWDDWKIIPSIRPVFTPPKQKNKLYRHSRRQRNVRPIRISNRLSRIQQ